MLNNDKEYKSALLRASYFIDHEQFLSVLETEEFKKILDLIEVYESKFYPVLPIS
jgi:antitoxin component HigA of HigAB toxin-antitoxin module